MLKLSGLGKLSGFIILALSLGIMSSLLCYSKLTSCCCFVLKVFSFYFYFFKQNQTSQLTKCIDLSIFFYLKKDMGLGKFSFFPRKYLHNKINTI